MVFFGETLGVLGKTGKSVIRGGFALTNNKKEYTLLGYSLMG